MSEAVGPERTRETRHPSIAYWRESDTRVKQFWYVSFCLMMSSLQDRLTGIMLREAGNLNWATTAFYYSGVHAGRLLCFACFGDYPTGHAQLAKLLAEPGTSISLDWRGKFQSYVGAGRPMSNPTVSHDELRIEIEKMFRDNRRAVLRFLPLLSKFKNLRNDCNYEALLIAHERNHFLVTENFQSLVSSAETVSQIATDAALLAYMTALDFCKQHVNAQACWADAHETYINQRLHATLADKFQPSHSAREVLNQFIQRLRLPTAPTGNQRPSDEVFLAPIMYDSFGEKQGLMDRWRNDVRGLSQSSGVE